jgi:hypothetical protein
MFSLYHSEEFFGYRQTDIHLPPTHWGYALHIP